MLSTKDKELILDIGSVSTINKPKNTTPLDVPPKLGGIVHMDILYGSGTSIVGYKYTLFIVDRAT